MGPFEFIKLDWLNVGLFEFVNVGPFEFVKLNWVNVDRLAAPWVCLSLSNSDRLNAGLFEFEFVKLDWLLRVGYRLNVGTGTVGHVGTVGNVDRDDTPPLPTRHGQCEKKKN